MRSSQWGTKRLKMLRDKAGLNVLLPSQVWVAKEGVQGKLEEFPIPFSDVRNIIEEIHLDDELTRSRCRAWLVLSSTKYLQADILCPGCIVDFRIMIRPTSSEFLSLLCSLPRDFFHDPQNERWENVRPEIAFLFSMFFLHILIFLMYDTTRYVPKFPWQTFKKSS